MPPEWYGGCARGASVALKRPDRLTVWGPSSDGFDPGLVEPLDNEWNSKWRAWGGGELSPDLRALSGPATQASHGEEEQGERPSSVGGSVNRSAPSLVVFR